MDVIDLTSGSSPEPATRRAAAAATAVASTSTSAAPASTSAEPVAVAVAAAVAGPAGLPRLPPYLASSSAARAVPYRNNSVSAPIDLTDDDIEFIGEQRLQLPGQAHAQGNDGRPAGNDNWNLQDRLREVAGLPFSRSVARPPPSNSNLRIIEEDPLRFGVAGPGPAAVAAANARLRRGGEGASNNEINDPPAGLNARRNRQRANYQHNHQADEDPGDFYYARNQPPARAGNQQLHQHYVPPPRQPEGRRRVADARNRPVAAGPNYFWHELDGDDGDDVDFGALIEEFGRGVAGGDIDGLGNQRDRPQRRAAAARAANNGWGQNIWNDALEGIWGAMGHLPFGRRQGVGAGGAGRMLGGGFGNLGMHFDFGGAAFNAMPAINHAHPPRRKVKAYSVKQSHPHFNKKKDGKDGFERDIIAPPELEEDEAEKLRQEAAAPSQEDKESIAEQSTPEIVPPILHTNASLQTESILASKDILETASRRSARNTGKQTEYAEEDEDEELPLEAPPAAIRNADVEPLDLDADETAASASSHTSSAATAIASTSTKATTPDTALGSMADPASMPASKTTDVFPKVAMRTIRAPVCTSCVKPLYLNQSSSGRPIILVCGHVICRACLDSAKGRYDSWLAEEEAILQQDANLKGRSTAKSTDIKVPPLSAWKGHRVGERFEEIDEGLSLSNARSRRDRKGKGKAREQNSRPRLGPKVPRIRESDDEYIDDIPVENESSRNDIEVPNEDLMNDGPRQPRAVLASTDAGTSSKRKKTKAELDEEEDKAAGLMPSSSAAEIAESSTSNKRKAITQIEPSALEIPLKDEAGNEPPVKKAKGNKKGAAVAKKKAPEKPVSKLDPEWLSCPVRDCVGGTDLSHPLGSMKGAWEMFV